MIYKAQTSHIGSNFSCVDILTCLFEKADFSTDKLVVSKGWVAATVYALQAEYGLILPEDLERYCQPGEEEYIGLIEPMGVFGAEFAGGSMGYGLPAGVGYALAKKMKGEEGRVYVLMSDGELAIGTTWESALIAKEHKLDNLMVIIDYNRFQAMGEVRDILDVEPLKDKWKSFGWEVRRCGGHGFIALERALTFPAVCRRTPCIVIAETVKGKGVSFMENNNLYHYKQLSDMEYRKASHELKQIDDR